MDQYKMDYGLDMDLDFNPSGPTECIIFYYDETIGTEITILMYIT